MEREDIDFRLLGEESSDLIIAFDDQFRYTYVNPQVERLVGRPRKELLGRTVWEVAPHTEGTVYAENYRRALRERVVIEFEAYYPPLDRWNRVRCVPEAGGGLVVFARNTTEEHHAEKVREQALQTLRASEVQSRRAARVLDSVSEAFVTLDRDWRITYVNAEAARINQKPVDSFLGKLHWEEWPASVGTEFERQFRRAMTERVPVRFLERYHVPGEYDDWIDVTAYPADEEDGGGIHLVYRDVTERRRQDAELAGALNREILVNTVGAAIRDSPLDPDAILRTAVSALGQAISADRCYFGRYDQAADYARLSPEWHRDGLPPIEGEYPMSRFSINRDPSYKAGGTQVVEDVRAFAPSGTVAEPSPLEALGLRAMIRVPIQLGNGMTTLAVAMSGEPRRWTENEVRAVETVASQVQSSLEVARLLAEERMREREARQRAERESVLNQIGTAIRASLPPNEVEAVAVTALGRVLGADRCYLAVVDAARDSVVIGRDWCPTEGVPTLSGKYRLSEFAVDVNEVFGGGATLAVTDTQAQGAMWGEVTAAVLSGMGVRSMINVPFHENGQLVAALGIAMAREPRQWTPEEVALVEAVATETREATEAARARQREHTIAEQLQEALTPAPPTEAPGLTLASYYRPALDEAGVGGDWMDVFPLGGGRGTAIVVADQSGKGLAAAAQVATVCNMLRAILYESGSVGDTVNRLNTILAEHDLLTGFATLFIGTYVADTASGIGGNLSYASCGQEPGLVWRATTGTVEELGPTGPVLGAFVGAQFGERTVSLSAGDILALFTDGLTEAGPTRKEMLEVEGVASLLAEAAAEQDATVSSVAARLITGVDMFARGGVRDDVCLLLARCTEKG